MTPHLTDPTLIDPTTAMNQAALPRPRGDRLVVRASAV
jgi:hypothetical protein